MSMEDVHSVGGFSLGKFSLRFCRLTRWVLYRGDRTKSDPTSLVIISVNATSSSSGLSSSNIFR